MKQQPHSKKSQSLTTWKDYGQCFYDFMFQNLSDWPVTSLQWGPIQQSTSQSILQRLYFSCRTDGIYNNAQNTWQNIPNIIIMATIELPNEDHYFINDLKSLFNPDAAKKHPNMKIKQIISHPGEVTVIRTSPINKKILASKNDCNEVYLWTSDRYKMSNNNYPSNPDLSLDATKSEKANYALRFAPSLPRLITASGDKIQLFDIENSGPTKRQLGSVMNPNSIKPFITLTGHDKVEDFAFKNNEVWVSGGQDKEIGLWDFRMKCVTNKIKNIHENDINSVSFQGNYILSGGQEGRVNIIDERKMQAVYRKETGKPVHSISFHPSHPYFAVGNDRLSIYSLDKIQQSDIFDPIFIHHGISTSINEFDWNQEHPMTLAVTCQQMDPQNPLHGGLIHVFKPNEMFTCSKDDALHKIEEAYKKLPLEERTKLDESL